MKKEIKLNRFPKMMILQYCRALKLGYSEKLAKAIGYAQALKYAIYKNRAFSYYKKSKKENIKNNNQNYKIEQFENFKVDENFKLTFIDNLPFVGKKKITESEFEKECLRKGIDNEILENMKRFYFNVLNNCEETLLKNENKFFNKVWKEIRDLNPLQSY